MTCTTCGRENPPHLTFCQECGQRLGPRIAPPTPPIGLGVDAGMPDVAHVPPSRLATSLGAGPSPSGAVAQAQAHAHAHAHAQAAHAQPARAAVGGGERSCRVCATPNGPNLRYCTSCGSTLEQSPAQVAPQPRMVEPAPVAPAPAPFGAMGSGSPQPAGSSFPNSPALPPQPAPIAPMRVVDLGNGGRPADAPRTCARCRGVVDGGAQFCKFCGASLAEATPAAAALPAPSPGVAPLLSHEPAALPRPNGAQPAPRPPAAPMQVPSDQLAPPTPFASFPVIASPVIASAATSAPSAPSTPVAQTTPPQAGTPVAQAGTPVAPAQAGTPVAQAHHAQAGTPVVSPPVVSPQAGTPVVSPPVAGTPPEAGTPVISSPLAAVPVVSPPAAPVRAVTRGRLVVIAKSGADGPSYPIGDMLDVGRSEGQIVVAEDPYLSPRHVRIAWTGSKLVLRDLASTNGVYIRLVAARDMGLGKGAPVGSAEDERIPGEVAVPLHDQDLILVGQQVLRFESAKDGEAGFGPATEHGTLLFGSPAAPRYARLSQRTVEGVTRDVYYVRKVETVLGRESGDVVFTEDPFLSRRHAAIRVLGANPGAARTPSPAGSKPSANADRDPPIQFALVDLGSSNGSFLRIRNEIDLVAGDHFRVGQQLFRVDFDNEPRGRVG